MSIPSKSNDGSSNCNQNETSSGETIDIESALIATEIASNTPNQTFEEYLEELRKKKSMF
mgnify:CR=1 FL=1